MAKRIVAKIGTYEKDGQSKGEYAKLGVMLNNNNGDYMLLDPSISLAGVLAKQNVMAFKAGTEMRDMVMISIFDDDNQGQNNNQGQQQAPQQQGGFNQSTNNGQQPPAQFNNQNNYQQQQR